MTDPSVSITRRAQPGEPVPGRRAGGGRVYDGGAHRRGARHRAPSRYPPGGRPSCGAGPSWRGGYRPASTRGSGPGVKPAPAPGRADLTGRAEWRLDACGPGRQASPPRRPAPGRPPPPPATARARTRSPPGTTPRPALPAFPSGRAGPPATRPAAQLARGAFPLSPFPGPAAPGSRLPPPARRGPDLTRRAERSVRRRGPTDGPPPGTPTAPGRPPATPDDRPRNPGRPAADDRGGDRRAAGIPGRVLPLAPAGAGPPAVRLPGGGVRVRRSALTAWLRRLEEDTQDGQEQGADGQLRRQVLGHQEARQRHRSPVPGPLGRRRARALQVVQGPPPRRRVPRRPEGRGPRPAALQPAHRPARCRDHRGGDGHLVRPCPRVRRGQVGQPRPGLPPVGRRGPGHRHRRPFREGAGRARGQGAAAGAVRLGVQPRHPRQRPAARRSPPPSTGPSAPPCPSPSWKTPRPCGSRSARAPRP